MIMSAYVDNVYLINMDKDDHRLHKVTKETERVGIKFERFLELDTYASTFCRH